MPTKKIVLIAVAVLVVLVAGGGAAYYIQNSNTVPADVLYVIDPVFKGTYTGTLPPLDYHVVYTDSIPQDARVLIDKHIADDVAVLKKRPYDGNTWMDLALWYHTANDFAACERVWKFLIDTTPNNVTALMNLGRMYHFDTPDFPKAEEYFRKAMAVNPERQDPYIELFELYRYSYKQNTTAAVEVMTAAIDKFPDNLTLRVGLGTYYRDTGRPAQARAELTKALAAARTAGDLPLVSSINEELSKLP